MRRSIRSWGCVLALCLSAEAKGEHGRIYPSLGVATDYRYNGVSLSDREPVWQANVHWQRADGAFAGVFSTGVDFNDPSGTSYELDLYAGRTLTRKRMQYTFEVLYASFPEQGSFGPTYDFAQLKARARRLGEERALGVSASWIPEASYGTGAAWRVVVDAEWKLQSWLSATANLGRRWIEFGADRTYWDFGLRAAFRHAVVDVRYVGVNVQGAQCGFNVEACEPAAVATLTWRLPSVQL